jgi:hypothetical protein
MESSRIVELAETARALAEVLTEDVNLASTREEHVRLTARANEARNLAALLQNESEPGEL